MEKVLVTGARGFIGSQLCKRLVSSVEVHAVSQQPPADVVGGGIQLVAIRVTSNLPLRSDGGKSIWPTCRQPER
jgi:nucleoside-diphosphate-sugar epimerase